MAMATSKGIETDLILVFLAMLMAGASAQSGCTSALMGLSPCLNYVSGNSSTPSSSCCSQLGNLVQTSPQCLCSLMNGNGSSLGFTFNQTLALRLPGACNVQTPPISQCSNATSGATTVASPPASSPSDPLNDAPAPQGSSSPSGTEGSKTVPTTSGNGNTPTSSGPGVTLSFPVFLLSLALVGSVNNF